LGVNEQEILIVIGTSGEINISVEFQLTTVTDFIKFYFKRTVTDAGFNWSLPIYIFTFDFSIIIIKVTQKHNTSPTNLQMTTVTMSTVARYAPERKIPRDLATFSELPKFISENQVKLFSKEEYTKYDIINYHLEQNKNDDAFYIVDLGEILEQFKLWKTHLPRVEPFYAVNPFTAAFEKMISKFQ